LSRTCPRPIRSRNSISPIALCADYVCAVYRHWFHASGNRVWSPASPTSCARSARAPRGRTGGDRSRHRALPTGDRRGQGARRSLARRRSSSTAKYFGATRGSRTPFIGASAEAPRA
jgi:hypothetical protein